MVLIYVSQICLMKFDLCILQVSCIVSTLIPILNVNLMCSLGLFAPLFQMFQSLLYVLGQVNFAIHIGLFWMHLCAQFMLDMDVSKEKNLAWNLDLFDHCIVSYFVISLESSLMVMHQQKRLMSDIRFIYFKQLQLRMPYIVVLLYFLRKG